MVSLEEQEKVVFMNSQYQDNSELIHRLQAKILEDVDTLDLRAQDAIDSKEYLQDRVTIFRFLQESQFNFNIAHEGLLETIRWRIEHNVAHLTWESSIEFFENEQGAFAFFHKSDKANRPLVFVRLRLFPAQFRDSTQRLINHIERFSCLMMEMARKMTWEITCDRERRGEPCVLVSQMTAIVNISKAPIIPLDAEIIRTMGVILDQRFPAMVSSVNVLNFGWMYQGIWTVIRYLLSEEAKEAIKFTTAKELISTINNDSILGEMGGNNDYKWTFESDETLQRYGTGRSTFNTEESTEEEEKLPSTPPARRSRTNSFASSKEDVFFDASDVYSSIPMTPPALDQEKFLVPVNTQLMPSATPTTLSGTSNHYTNFNIASWVGLRMGMDFLTSFIDIQKNNTIILFPRKNSLSITKSTYDQDINELMSTSTSPIEDASISIVNPSASISGSTLSQLPPNESFLAVTGYNLKRMEVYFRRLTHHILQLSLGQRGMVYWVLIYFFLRGPVESFVKNSLLRTSALGPPRIGTVTIGITAAVAALVSSSFTSTIERYRLPEHF